MKGRRRIKAQAHAQRLVAAPGCLRPKPLLRNNPGQQRRLMRPSSEPKLEEILRLERLQHRAALDEGSAQPPCP